VPDLTGAGVHQHLEHIAVARHAERIGRAAAIAGGHVVVALALNDVTRFAARNPAIAHRAANAIAPAIPAIAVAITVVGSLRIPIIGNANDDPHTRLGVRRRSGGQAGRESQRDGKCCCCKN